MRIAHSYLIAVTLVFLGFILGPVGFVEQTLSSPKASFLGLYLLGISSIFSMTVYIHYVWDPILDSAL